MDVSEVSDKVFLYEGSCNTYYIDDEKKILIDAGVDFTKKVDILILTHFHVDHILYAKKIKDKNNCEVMIGKRDIEPLTVIDRVWPTWGGVKVREFVPDTFLKDGDEIDAGSIILKVIEVPGHTIGSIALLDEASKILFSGDTLFAHGITGRIDFSYSDPQSMDDSLEKLKSIKPKLILPGHGEIERQ